MTNIHESQKPRQDQATLSEVVFRAERYSHQRYTNVIFDPKTRTVTGTKRYGFAHYGFAYDVELFAVDLAIELDFRTIPLFMSLTDGPPAGISGYDWVTGDIYPHDIKGSGLDFCDIKNSSSFAKRKMFVKAQRIIKGHHFRLSAMGLPDDLIDVLVGDEGRNA